MRQRVKFMSPFHAMFQVTDSFQSNDPFAQAMHTQQQQEQNVMPLQKPPKWLQRPAGANFGVSLPVEFLSALSSIYIHFNTMKKETLGKLSGKM